MTTEWTQEDTDAVNEIEAVIGSGLFSQSDEEYFSWDGCDYCQPGIGNTVYDVSGYVSLAEAQTTPDNTHEFQICGDCLNRLYYGGAR